MVQMPDFKGYINDVGGPTANFRHPACKKQLKYGACKDRQCLFQTAFECFRFLQAAFRADAERKGLYGLYDGIVRPVINAGKSFVAG